MSNPFPVGKRPWLRITAAKRATSTLVLGDGEFAVTDTGEVIAGDGTTQLRNRPVLVDRALADQLLAGKVNTAQLVDALSGITKTSIGLSNVDNTADVNKPLSTAQQTAIADAIAAITLNSLGGITPSAVDTKVTAAVNGLLNGAPGALDTLKELADAIGDDANYAASVTNALAARAIALTVTGTKTAAYTAGLNELIPIDATSAGVTVTLPTAPAAGTRVTVKKTDATANIVTIARGGSADVFNKTGGSTTLTLTLQNQSATIQYAGGVWYVSGGDLPLSSLQTSLSATYVPKNRDSVNARDFGVVPSSGTTTAAWTDVTTAFQAAIDYCVTNGIGRLYVPAGNYLINGTITIGAPLLIEGSFGVQMKNLSNALSGGGTVISTTGGTAGNFVFNFTPAAPATNTWGVGIRNITFYGLATGSAVDRPCIRLDHIWSELYIENVNIFGFNRQGLVSQNSQDGTVLNLTILACGSHTSGNYASLDLLSNTNALHFAGLHIENTPYHLHVGNGARHNQFVDCKFEQYAYPPAVTWSPIWVDTTYENAFLGCQFVQDSVNDTYFYTSQTQQPPFIKVTGSNTHAIFTGCMFTTSEQTRQSVAGIGGRWLAASSPAVVQVTGCEFSSVYTGTGAYPIVLSDYCNFTNNKLKTYTDGSTRQIIQMGQRNVITGNTFLNQDTNTVTAGAVFNCTGQRNVFASNQILGNVFNILTGQTFQSVAEVLRSTSVVVSGANPNVGWAEAGASQMYLVTNPSATTMTGMVGIAQREITLLFTNTNTTLKATGSTLALRGGVDVTPPSYSLMRFWYDGGTWWEISRSFSTAADSVVQSVAGKTGTVVLTASDVGADAAGAAATTQAYAVQRTNHTGTQPATTVTGLATVATSGAYSDLTGKPTIPTQYTDTQAATAAAAALTTNAGTFLIVGNYSAPGGNLGNVALSEGVVKGAILQAGRTGSVDTLAVNVTTAGSTGALIRLGLYSVNLTTNVCTLVADGGTLDATTTGVKTATLTGAAITKGTYYVLTATCQGAATTKPSVQTITSADPLVSGTDAPTVLSNSLAGLQISSGVTAALPSTATASVAVGIPRIAGRAA